MALKIRQRHVRSAPLGATAPALSATRDSVEKASVQAAEAAVGQNHHNIAGGALVDDAFGDGPRYLKPNTRLQVSMYEGKPVIVTLPNTVDLEITDTPPEIKGATATNQNKSATLETGLVVQVPEYLEPGQKIKINTESGKFISRI